MKAIYEVRLEVDNATVADFLAWTGPHMKDVVEAGGFERAEMFALEQVTPGKKTWVVQYIASGRDIIENYINNHSKALRADAVARFGDRLKSERRILIFQEAFPA